MQLTSNYRLRKPEGTDPVDVKDLNDNADVIDTELAKKADKTGMASDMVTSFTQAASRTNITSGEKLSTSLGKIMKFFTDLKAVAFSGSYNDLSNKPTIPSGAAANYPVANNDTTNNAGYLVTAQVAYQHGKEIDQINSDLGGIRIVTEGSGASTKYYAQRGADTASKKRLDSVIIDLGTSTTIDVTKYYSDYANLSVNNFYVCVTGLGLAAWASAHGEVPWQGGSASPQTTSKSYNSKTGILTIGGIGQSYDYNRGDYNPHVAASATVEIRTFLIVA